MATELITFKADGKFIKEVDTAVKKLGYHSRTEMIRDSLRKKIDEAELKENLREIVKLRGASKKKTTDEELEQIREEAFEELAKRFK